MRAHYKRKAAAIAAAAAMLAAGAGVAVASTNVDDAGNSLRASHSVKLGNSL